MPCARRKDSNLARCPPKGWDEELTQDIAPDESEAAESI